jgi:putative multiple sugar transport system permease protein
VGGIICLFYLIMEIVNRSKKIRKGYDVDSAISTYGKVGVICIAVLALSYLLGKNKGIPFVLIIVLVIVAVYSYFTSKTVPGRTLYAIGGNEKAAKLSGINTNRSLFMAYTNMAFLAAVAALVCVARFNSAAPSAGTNYELDAIGSCFIGGASAYGGTGTVGGAVVGAIFMGVLNNGMSILGIDANWQKVVKGLVLIIAVLVDVLNKRRAKSS